MAGGADAAWRPRGGWRSRDTAQHFADYAAVVTEHLGDRLKNIVVLNEGRVLAEGTPAQVRANPLVAEAYLGTSA